MKTEIVAEGMKLAPPVAVTGVAHVQGWSMQEYLALATILYIVLQAAYLGWKWYQEYKAARKRESK